MSSVYDGHATYDRILVDFCQCCYINGFLSSLFNLGLVISSNELDFLELSSNQLICSPYNYFGEYIN